MNHWCDSSLDCSCFKRSEEELETLDFKHTYVFTDDLSQGQKRTQFPKSPGQQLNINLTEVLLYLREVILH